MRSVPQNEEREGIARVPQTINMEFWIANLLAVMMGETVADCLASNLGLGLFASWCIMSATLVVCFCLLSRQTSRASWSYWTAVVVTSVVGVLTTDNMVANLGMSLEATTVFFGIALVGTFAFWHFWEATLSIHSITNTRREMWCWLAVLFISSLGAATDNLVAEGFALGHFAAGLYFLGIAMVVWIAHLLKAGEVLTFWLAYTLARPLGSSLGDLLSQSSEYGGFNFGATASSMGFLACIVATVAFMTYARRGFAFADEARNRETSP